VLASAAGAASRWPSRRTRQPPRPRRPVTTPELTKHRGGPVTTPGTTLEVTRPTAHKPRRRRRSSVGTRWARPRRPVSRRVTTAPSTTRCTCSITTRRWPPSRRSSNSTWVSRHRIQHLHKAGIPRCNRDLCKARIPRRVRTAYQGRQRVTVHRRRPSRRVHRPGRRDRSTPRKARKEPIRAAERSERVVYNRSRQR
jgi:hypothetical protein